LKTVSYDGKKWKGEVVFFDPMTMQQEAAWERAMAEFRKAIDAGLGISSFNLAALPGILECVSEWKLTDFPERITITNFPAHPRKERANLISWLVTQIAEIYKSDDDPNE
jgi:hypothetical protein